MSTKLKLVLFLVPAIAAAVFILWWRSPTQVITRKVDALLDLADVGALRLASADHLPGQLRILVAPTLEVSAPRPIPTGTLGHPKLIDSFETLHSNVASCRITRGDLAIRFPSPSQSLVKTPLEAKVSWGRGSGITRRYHAEMHFTRSAEGWQLDQLRLAPR